MQVAIKLWASSMNTWILPPKEVNHIAGIDKGPVVVKRCELLWKKGCCWRASSAQDGKSTTLFSRCAAECYASLAIRDCHIYLEDISEGPYQVVGSIELKALALDS